MKEDEKKKHMLSNIVLFENGKYLASLNEPDFIKDINETNGLLIQVFTKQKILLMIILMI